MNRTPWAIALMVAGCVPNGPAERFDGGHTAADAGFVVTARDAGAPKDASTSLDAHIPDDGGHALDSGSLPQSDAGSTPPPELFCDRSTLRNADGAEVASYETPRQCDDVVAARGDGVICVLFRPGDPIGPGGWDEAGWRAMNWRTGIGLGRRPHQTYEDCLDATRNARGGVVCTNTGVGYKSAHIETNHWCGASSALRYCLIASAAARDHWVCSFPSEGDGSGPGWNLTHIDGSTCEYTTGGLQLDDCNSRVP